uniref:TEP1-F n=1 Tax=Anopheles albimanus TaxID=7167 RepID=A0A8W7JZM2_ANOAL
MWWLRIATICASLILVSLAQELIVVGPNYFTSDRNYTVTIFNMMNNRVTLEAIMKGIADDGDVTFTKSPKNVAVKSNALEEVVFQIPYNKSTKSGRLSINGKNGFEYRQEVELSYHEKSISGFIQLSKPVYKPGDSVQFRVIVLDRDLRPPSGRKKVTVSVQDSNGNNIRIWSHAPLYNGVFEGQLDIASSPLLGTYNIEVQADGEYLLSKTFDVMEYVLSSFDVNVYTTVTPLEEHQALNLTIEANYYFGKPAIGTAKIDLYLNNDKPLLNTQFKTQIARGKANVILPFDEHLNIMNHDSKDVIVNVTFTEQFTNRTITKKFDIVVYKHKYRVALEEVPNSYPQRTLKVEHQDGGPAVGVKLQVKDDDWIRNFTSDDTGMVRLLLPSHTETISVLHAGKEVLNTNIGKRSSAFINVLLDSINPAKRNQTIKLMLKSSHRLEFFIYYVVSKGDIVDAKYVTASKIKNNIYYFTTSDRMLPRAKIIVVTVIDGAILHHSVQIEFSEFPYNFELTISEDDSEVRPGGQITLLLNGTYKSYVALASYDKSLLQLGTDHDIVREDVLNLIDMFQNTGQDSIDCFQRVGLFILPESTSTICGANDKSARQDDIIMKHVSRQTMKWRTDFSESWLWMNLSIPRKGEKKLTKNVPDTTTSWYLTGFSIDPVYGFGIINKPVQFTTAQPFYIVDHLPYSIRRGEAVLLQFTLFSTLHEPFISDVTLCNVENQMEFMGHPKSDESFTKSIIVPPNVGILVEFLVKAKTLGEMIVRVKGIITFGQERDAIEKVIRVLPEKFEQTHVKTELVAPNILGKQSFEIPLDIPKTADGASVRIECSIVPNIFTFVIPNLQSLLSVPTGCGEQNMVRFVPNVVVLDFLNASDSHNASAISYAKKLLQSGYQNQLKYRNADGSFAVWPNSRSSVFLTAFVGKSFHIASKYITIDTDIISSAFNWLSTQQQPDGRFNEIGYIFNQYLQGGLRDGIALTSYVMIAFLEYKSLHANHTAVIKKGMAYIGEHVDRISDSYDLSIATYAMWLHNHSKKSVALKRLISSSKIESNGNLRYWPRETSQIETTAYALLSIIEANDNTTALATARWLFNQTYVTGSFSRTQDTFVGLKALGKFTKWIRKTAQHQTNTYVDLYAVGVNKSFVVLPAESITYRDIQNTVRKLRIDVTSKDSGLLRVTYKYLLDLINVNQRFNITVNQLLASGSSLKLGICSNFIPENRGERSNMALVEVTFPSGFVADSKSNSELWRTNGIQNVEYLHGGTMVVLYYNNMGDERNCFSITAYMRFKVAFRRPAFVKVHDYYNPNYNAIHQYSLDKTEICDICPRGDCDCN